MSKSSIFNAPPDPPSGGALWHLLQTSDSLFPTGAYAHSGGLEGMVTEGWIDDPGRAIEAVLRRSFAKVDLPACSLAHRAAREGGIDRLVEIDEVVDSLKAPREAREAGRSLGRRRLRSLALEDSLLQQYGERVEAGETPGQQPVVVGLHLAVTKVSRRDALLAATYTAAAGLVSAAMKLLPLGQARAQELLTETGRIAPELVEVADRTPLEDLGSFTPLLDIASMRHEVAYTRLFIS